MKTHTARWFQNSFSTWILKERGQDGGKVLATITGGRSGFYDWEIHSTPILIGTHFGLYAAQRAVRRALSKGAGDD